MIHAARPPAGNDPPQVPTDDAPVPDETLLYRLVPTDQCSVGPDGEWEFNSGAFDNTTATDDMSVVIDDTLQALERGTDDLPARTFPGDEERWGVAVIRDAGYLRNDESQEIRRTPRIEEPPEPAHGDVRGARPGPGASASRSTPRGSSARRRLRSGDLQVDGGLRAVGGIAAAHRAPWPPLRRWGRANRAVEPADW